jgi:hypothetical protein
MVEQIRLRGCFRITLGDQDGNIVDERVVNNLVVTAGRAWVLKQIQSVNHVTSQNLSHIAIGSGLVAPATGDTALGNEVTRVAISSFDTTALTANPPAFTAQAVIASNEGNTTLGEVAVLNSNSGGTMLCRATFASFVKATSNILNISYTISD